MAARERYRLCQQERDMGHVSKREILTMAVTEKDTGYVSIREIQDLST